MDRSCRLRITKTFCMFLPLEIQKVSTGVRLPARLWLDLSPGDFAVQPKAIVQWSKPNLSICVQFYVCLLYCKPNQVQCALLPRKCAQGHSPCVSFFAHCRINWTVPVTPVHLAISVQIQGKAGEERYPTLLKLSGHAPNLLMVSVVSYQDYWTECWLKKMPTQPGKLYFTANIHISLTGISPPPLQMYPSNEINT